MWGFTVCFGTELARKDEIPAELYETRSSRLSDASLYLRFADGTERGAFPWRTAIIATLLFVVGLVFLLLGLLHFRSYDRQTFVAFVVLGSIAFIPGAYAAFNIVQWYRGVPGFHLSECMFSVSVFHFAISFPTFVLTCFFPVHFCIVVAYWDDYRT